MGVQTVRDLGEIGTVAGIRSPLAFTVYQGGSVWDLTGATSLTLEVWDTRTHTAVTPNGTCAAVGGSETSGSVTYTPGVSDPISDSPGSFEARVKGTQGGKTQSSDLLRFTIGAGPT